MRKTAQEWKDCYSSSEFQKKYHYDGNDLGVSCTQKETRFLLWSPYADQVTLNLYSAGDQVPAFETHCMERLEKGLWEYKVSSDLHGVYYDYMLKMDGEVVQSADPYARACGVNGFRSMVVDLSRTNPDGWEEDKAPESASETIIYELHVKEFSWDPAGGFPEEKRGTYGAFLHTDTSLNQEGKLPTGIPYLKNLGVTHVQLMPVYDYGSVNEAGDRTEFNWGYDPVNYNVPEGSYSSNPNRGEIRIRELKEMIQSLHRQGLRVIMDVVYNHTYSLDSWFQKTAPWYFYRVGEDGKPSNGSACGNDVASERYMCSKYILESVLYWAEEYHMDGFRFDLMGLLDVNLMNRIRRELDARYGKGEKILFGEPWAAADTAIEPGACQALKKNIEKLDVHVGMFCDVTRDSIKGMALKPKKPGFVNGGVGFEQDILDSAKAWCTGNPPYIKAPSQVVTYVSSHDNQTLWDKLTETVLDEELKRKIYRLTAGIYMTCQGIIFFLSGEEFARTKNGLDDSYNAPISLNRLDWKKAWKEKELVDYYRGLIALRKLCPGLYDKSLKASGRIYGEWKKKGIVGFFVDNYEKNTETIWETLYMIYNSREKSKKIQLPKGHWEILVNGESSFLWQNPEAVEGRIEVAPVSVLVLGKR